jgi:assimilatory nitrate reductase electron transfer subunit
MAGVETPFPGAVRWNYQLAGGIPFVAIGRANPDTEQGFEIARDLDQSAGTYRKEVRRDGRLVGAVLLGDTTDAAALESAIAEQAAD